MVSVKVVPTAELMAVPMADYLVSVKVVPMAELMAAPMVAQLEN